MEDKLQKEEKAWRDKRMQHEVRLCSESVENKCYSGTVNTGDSVC